MFSYVLVQDNDTINNFINDCKKMYKYKSKSFYGIDLEYNLKNKIRTIGLMQIILIYENYKQIYILEPLSFNKKHIKLLIKYVFCSYCIKIFHGSDSLDYHYIYKDIIKNKKKFIQFINTSVDTRLLCEISKRILSKNNINVNKKCSIYNALLDHNIIDKQLFDKLEELSSKINYNKEWNIKSLSDTQLKYSIYDIYYLYDLLEVITNKYITVSNLLKTDLISLINRLYRFNMLNKFEIINLSNLCKKHIPYIDYDNVHNKIMKIPLMKIKYDNIQETNIYIEDILSIDIIRKNIMYCLTYYSVDNTIMAEFEKNKYFMYMKGSDTIMDLMKLVNIKKDINE